MGEIIFENDVAISLGSIDGEEQLKPRPDLINIDPPPRDGKCMCCGRHISELKPFGKAGDPLVGDFDGALLVVKGRPSGPPPLEIVSEIYDKFIENRPAGQDYETADERLIKEYGEEDAERILFAVHAYGCVGSSWECRDCVVLDSADYFDKLGWDLEKYYSWEPGQKGGREILKFEKCSESGITAFCVPMKERGQN